MILTNKELLWKYALELNVGFDVHYYCSNNRTTIKPHLQSYLMRFHERASEE